MSKKKITKPKENVTEIVLHTSFKLMFEHNIQSLVSALTNCGYFVKVRSDSDSGSKVIEVYKYNLDD